MNASNFNQSKPASPKSPLIAITRAFPDCTRTARQVEEVGFESFLEPLGDIKLSPLQKLPIAQKDRQDFGIILTSSRAVAGLKDLSFRNYPSFYVVGERTAHVLQEQGFENIATTAKSVENLKNWLIKRKNDISHPLLYIRGKNISAPLAVELREHGYRVTERIVYSFDQFSDFSDEFIDLISGQRPLIILLMSARTSDLFFNLLEKHKSSLKADFEFLCFSRDIAEKTRENLEKITFLPYDPPIEYCDDPSEDALIQKLMLMYDEKI